MAGEDLPNQEFIEKNNEVFFRPYRLVEVESDRALYGSFSDEFIDDSFHG